MSQLLCRLTVPLIETPVFPGTQELNLETTQESKEQEPKGPLEQEEGPVLAEAGFAEALESGHCGQLRAGRSVQGNETAGTELHGWMGQPFLRFRSEGHWLTFPIVFNDI